MLLTVSNAKNDQVFQIEVEDNDSIDSIKTIIEVESGIIIAN